jgi:hypothetical protein
MSEVKMVEVPEHIKDVALLIALLKQLDACDADYRADFMLAHRGGIIEHLQAYVSAALSHPVPEGPLGNLDNNWNRAVLGLAVVAPDVPAAEEIEAIRARHEAYEQFKNNRPVQVEVLD